MARTSSRVGWPPAAFVNSEKSEEPMPTTMASTMTLTPLAMTLPSTFSARKAVRPKRPKGTRTKPARVTSLNSISTTKICTAMMKKATITKSATRSRTTIWTMFSKKPGKPPSSAAASRSGLQDETPSAASRPGRRKSSAEIPAPEAFRPRPEKLLSTTRERVWKLPIKKAKNPT